MYSPTDFREPISNCLRRCDLGIALHNGTKPTFFSDPFSEPLMPYDLASLAAEETESLATKQYWRRMQQIVDPDLIEAWVFLKRFCSTINFAAENKRQLPKEILQNAMASVMYRLLRMEGFNPMSIDEAVYLGLLVFSSHIFLTLQDMRLPHNYLPDKYRSCLLNLNLPSTLPPQIILWLLTIGSFATFTSADDTWLVPWLRVNLDICEVHSWIELREQMKALPWIDTLHDKPTRAMYELLV